jgi:hypothetical protein
MVYYVRSWQKLDFLKLLPIYSLFASEDMPDSGYATFEKTSFKSNFLVLLVSFVYMVCIHNMDPHCWCKESIRYFFVGISFDADSIISDSGSWFTDAKMFREICRLSRTGFIESVRKMRDFCCVK